MMHISNLGTVSKDVKTRVEKVKRISKVMSVWKNNKLGLIPCLGLWQMFIGSQLRYAGAVFITSN